MNPQHSPLPSFSRFVSIVVSHRKRWLVPAIGVTLLVGVYAVVRPATWEASQALIVRNEAANTEQPVGKFGHAEERKTVQETILELVKSRDVLGAALEDVGPPAGYDKATAAWPTVEDVADLQERVKLSPPKGAEFGTTEIFYLKVQTKDDQRSKALTAAISTQLVGRLQKLRDATAKSMIDELHKAVQLAGKDLADSTARLRGIETQVGSDLAELRILHDSASGQSALRRTITEIRGELRQAHAEQNSNAQLLALLEGAQQDADRLVATPNQLLESQPAVRRLKEGLVDAQLRTAQLQGRMLASHPLVLAGKAAEDEIRGHLHNELAAAVRGIQVDLDRNAESIALLDKQLAEAAGKLDGLAALRADYSNMVSETSTRTQLLERAEQRLSEARVSQATAGATSLIGRIGGPEVGVKPLGPSRAAIMLAGLAGGLMAGFGVLLLTVEPVPTERRRTYTAPLPPRPQRTIRPLNITTGLSGQGLTIKEALEKLAYSHCLN